MNRLLTTTLALTASLAAACGDFQERTTIIDLRTIAVMAAPPELHVAAGQPDAPFVTSLTALVVDPAGGQRPISYEVVACPKETDAVTAATGRAGAVCKPYDPLSEDDDRSIAVTPPDAPPSTPAGQGPEHQLTIPDFEIPRELLLRAAKLDPFSALGLLDPGALGPEYALPIFPSPIVFQLTIRAGTEAETSVKRVIFSVPPVENPDQPPNSNPSIGSIVAYRMRDGETPVPPILTLPPSVDATADEVPVIPPGGQLWIEPREAAAEMYLTPVLKRGTTTTIAVEELRETVRFSFAASAGVFNPPNTSTEPSPLRGPMERIHLESRYTAPKVPPPDGKVTIWVTARDERGGTSWTRRTLRVGPAP